MTWKRASGCDAGTCVEVLLPWRSNEEGWQGHVVVRSTTNPAQTVSFDIDEWEAFVAGVKNKEFDL